MAATLLPFFRGQTHRFEQLLEPHLDGLYRLAYRFTRQQQDAEDLVQDLVLKLYQNQSSLLQAKEPKPWLARSLRNLHIDSFRKESRTPHGSLHIAGDEPLQTMEDDVYPQPDIGLEQNQLQDYLTQALSQLQEEWRDLVVMHDVEGYTLNELTQVFDCPLGTLKSRLHRARKQLKSYMSENMERFSNKGRVSG